MISEVNFVFSIFGNHLLKTIIMIFFIFIRHLLFPYFCDFLWIEIRALRCWVDSTGWSANQSLKLSWVILSILTEYMVGLSQLLNSKAFDSHFKPAAIDCSTHLCAMFVSGSRVRCFQLTHTWCTLLSSSSWTFVCKPSVSFGYAFYIFVRGSVEDHLRKAWLKR